MKLEFDFTIIAYSNEKRIVTQLTFRFIMTNIHAITPIKITMAFNSLFSHAWTLSKTDDENCNYMVSLEITKLSFIFHSF